MPARPRKLRNLLLSAALRSCLIPRAGGAPVWTQTAVLSTGAAGDAFGWASCVSSNGDLLVVGSAGAGNGAGALHTYVRVGSPAGGWQLASSFAPLPNETFGGSAYGSSLSLSLDAQTLLSGVFTSYESRGGVALFTAVPGPPGRWSLKQLIEALSRIVAD